MHNTLTVLQEEIQKTSYNNGIFLGSAFSSAFLSLDTRLLDVTLTNSSVATTSGPMPSHLLLFMHLQVELITFQRHLELWTSNSSNSRYWQASQNQFIQHIQCNHSCQDWPVRVTLSMCQFWCCVSNIRVVLWWLVWIRSCDPDAKMATASGGHVSNRALVNPDSYNFKQVRQTVNIHYIVY